MPYGHICASISSSFRLLVNSSFWQVVAYTKAQFQRFREVSPWGRADKFSFLFLPSKSSVYFLGVFPILPCFVALAFPFFLLLLQPCTSQRSQRASPLFGPPLYASIIYPLRYLTFRYFLPYIDLINYVWKPPFQHAPYFILPFLIYFSYLSLFVLSGCIPSSVLNTVLLVVPAFLRSFLSCCHLYCFQLFYELLIPFPYISCIF